MSRWGTRFQYNYFEQLYAITEFSFVFVALSNAYFHAEAMCPELEFVIREQSEVARVFTKRGLAYSSFPTQERNPVFCVTTTGLAEEDIM